MGEGASDRLPSERSGWKSIRDRRMSEPGAAETHRAARLAYELGRNVRALREQHGWSQSQLSAAAGMTQSAVARFEAGGTVPSLRVLDRLAQALDAELTVQVTPRPHVA
jgi:ribosome-binding protein aMBF1 (putative translation factor)